MSETKQQFLIIQTAFIGDVILATSLIEFFKSVYPGCEVDFVLRKSNASILKGNPNIRRLITWDKSLPKLKGLKTVISEIRQVQYDVAVNVHRYTSTGLMMMMARARQKVGYAKNPLSVFYNKKVPHRFEKGLHEVDRLHELVKHLDSRYCQPKLFLSQEVLGRVAGYKTVPYRVIAPMSVWFTKQYPVEQWVRFLDKSPFAGHTYLVGAPDDFDHVEKIRTTTTNERVTNLCGQLNLLHSAALMKDAVMNYVNDSGPMHLCTAVNAPVKAIYCSTTPDLGFGPLSDNREVIETEEVLPCRPCGLHGHSACPEGHFKCAYSIDLRRLEIE